MALVIPNASSLFPSAAWWQALANSINSEMAQLRSESIGASILTSGTNIDTVTASSTWTTWANSNPNTPETGTGILRTWWVTDTAGAQMWISATNTASMYLRFRGSGGWSAWKRIDAQYAIDQAKAYTDTAVLGARGGSGSGTKVVPLALTVGGSAAASSLGAVGVRMPMQWGARVTRWRVHVRNINPRFGTNQPGAVSLTGLWFGQGDGSGSFTGAATQINGAVSTPADGSEWVSKWVTTPLEAGTRYLLAYGLNTTGTQSVVGGGWTTASPADAANSAAAKTARTALPLDVWIEAETAATTPVIAAWGDSLSSGVGATTPVYDSVVSQYCRANGALPVHYTASGDSAASWAGNLSAYKWTRWATLAKPDVTIAAMGSNDVFNGDALATIQANWQAAVDNIRATISPAVVVTTITPRDGVTGVQEDTRRSLNTWLKTLPKGRDVFDLVPAVSSDDETLTPAYSADGIHLTTAGYAAEVGTITRALAFAPSAGPQGPKGDKGDKGDPGGSDAATATYINTGTDTQAALIAFGGPRWAAKDYLPVNAKDYGAKGDGTTDDTTALINAEADAYAQGRALLIPGGRYKTTGTVQIRVDTISPAATIEYYGTGRAVLVGTDSSGVYLTDKSIQLPRVRLMNAPAGAWDGTSEGVYVVNINQCRLWVPRVERFEKGLTITGNGGGSAYSDIHLGTLWVNHENLILDQRTTGWANQLQFYGGRITHSTSVGTPDDPTACHLRLGSTAGNAINPPDGNTFYGLSMEGVNTGAGGWARYRVINYGRYNQFHNCRWETSSGVPAIDSREYASNNIIWGGYHADKIVLSGVANAVEVRTGSAGAIKATNTSAPVLTSGTNTTLSGWTTSGGTAALIGATYDSGTGEFTPRAGRWRITAKVTYAAATATNSLTSRLVCGTTIVDQTNGPSSTATAVSHSLAGNYRFNGTETLKVQAQQSTGANLALASTSPYVNLQAEYVGPL